MYKPSPLGRSVDSVLTKAMARSFIVSPLHTRTPAPYIAPGGVGGKKKVCDAVVRPACCDRYAFRLPRSAQHKNLMGTSVFLMRFVLPTLPT